MKFNTSILPKTFIPGTTSGNMSPQMLPESTSNNKTMTMTSKAARSDSTRSTKSASDSKSPWFSSKPSGKRVGGKTNIKRDNKYSKAFGRSNGGNVNINLSSGSNSLDTGRWGYNSQDSTPIKIDSGKVSLFTNPLLPGEFDTTFTDLALSKLAVNVVDYDIIGFKTTSKDSIAYANFKILYSKMIAILANNPSKAYQVIFSNILNVRVYFVSLFNLLLRYYEMESILAWNPPYEEFNVTLNTMRKIFDRTEILQLKIDLVEFLQIYYLPTEFVNLANFFNQTFKTGDVSTSKVFKFMTPALASAIRDNSATAYITTVRDQIKNLRNDTDDASSGKLTAYSMAQLSGFFEKDFTFGQVYSSGLPAAANRAVHDPNRAVHDLDAYDIFINQSVLYSNSGANFVFPDYAAGSSTPYASHKEGSEISTFQIACQGVSSSADDLLKTGFMGEDTITINDINGQNRSINKLWMCAKADDTMKVYTRSTVRTKIFDDLHFVDLNSTAPFTKVSIPPSHTQLLYMNGDPVKDVATRNFQNKLFGNL